MENKKVCNLCGKELDIFDLNQAFVMNNHIGYGSMHDGDDVSLRLCCDCFDKLIEKCVVSPIIARSLYGIS